MHFEIDITIKKSSSLALFNYLPMLFYPKETFTYAFHSFVKNIFRFSYPDLTKNDDAKVLRDYNDIYVSMKKKAKKMNSL